MKADLKVGLSLTQTQVVGEQDTAKFHGSGSLLVFATPAMVALMENTALAAVGDYLDQNEDSVGIQIATNHIKATKLGDTVTCTAKLTEIDKRKLTFEIEAKDKTGLIGKAVHSRFIIDPVKFMSKL